VQGAACKKNSQAAEEVKQPLDILGGLIIDWSSVEHQQVVKMTRCKAPKIPKSEAYTKVRRKDEELG